LLLDALLLDALDFFAIVFSSQCAASRDAGQIEPMRKASRWFCAMARAHRLHSLCADFNKIARQR